MIERYFYYSPENRRQNAPEIEVVRSFPSALQDHYFYIYLLFIINLNWWHGEINNVICLNEYVHKEY